MRRRDFIAGLGAAALPLAARAQQAGRVARLAVVFASPKGLSHVAAFFDELQVQGFSEGKNLQVDSIYGQSDQQVSEFLVTIAKSPPDLIFTTSDNQIRIAHQNVPDVPIVGLGGDLMASGLIHSFARPGGRVTGHNLINTELDGKRQDILIEAVPGARKLALLLDTNAGMSAPAHLAELQGTTRAHGIEPAIFEVRALGEIPPALEAIKASGAAGVNALSSPLFLANRRILIERTTALRLPAIFEWPEMVEEGGLLGYGARLSGIFRQLARQVAKALQGAKPADMPVEQATTFELAINLKTAKAIGHEIPPGLVLRADKLVE